MPSPFPARLPAGDPDAIVSAVEDTSAGGSVGMPTETVYGIGVVPVPEPVEALIRAKQRPEEKGIPLLLDGLDQVEGLVLAPPPARQLADLYWPGPLTLVLPLRHPHLVPEAVTGGRDTLALRVPVHPVPRALARTLGPTAVTSADRSGESAATTADELSASVGHALALVLDDGPVRGGVPCSVDAVAADGRWLLLREGAIGRTVIEAALGEG